MQRRRARGDEPAAKRQHKAEAIDIPHDVLEQVLLQLPVKSLMRFKSVCKSWRDTIASPHFERCQLQVSRARRPSMLVLPLWVMAPPFRMDRIMFFAYPGYGAAAELMHEKAWSTGIGSFGRPLHCDGLIVVAAALSSQIFVCNPATKELVALPAGSPDYCYGCHQKIGFGVDPSTLVHMSPTITQSLFQ
ncbi:F-box/LRR-repeat protein [Panicum miliaceum]|uniref:F-box/LRR-repeat protein n=1 Tax=Panicum miliaceum TaxID=4540 RepID=A0A3L6TQA0_PANMI|nr:F-box/LRR-repeat protein [Panicum miliaceum]